MSTVINEPNTDNTSAVLCSTALSAWGESPIRCTRSSHNSPDRSVSVAYVGRLHNPRALGEQLGALTGEPGSDTVGQLLLRGYEVWGEALPEHVDGTCSFILWDARRPRLLMARDRMGVGRIYYAQDNGAVTAAFGARALLQESAREPDVWALSYALTLGYVPSPLSIWRGLRRVEPAQCVSWTPGQDPVTRTYWDPPRETAVSGTQPSWAGVFEPAVDEVLANGEPAGLLLSGGLDSSSIALAARRLGHTVGALSFQAPGCPDESGLAKSLARHLGISDISVTRLSTDDADSLLSELAASIEEPQCHPAQMTSHIMHRAAAQRFAAILTGDGAEEALGGHCWYDSAHAVRAAVSTPGPLRRWVRRMRSRGHAPAHDDALVRRFTSTSELHRHLWRMRPVMLLPEELRAFMPDLNGFDDAAVLAPLHKYFAAGLPSQRALQRLDLMTRSADAQMAKIQQAAQAIGLEAYHPFLARRVQEWGLERPMDQRELVERKPVLRDYLRGNVPDAIVNLPKHGLRIPWPNLLPPDAAIAEIRAGYWVREGYWSGEFERYVQAGTRHWRHRLWSLTLLTRWADAWLR